MRFQFLRTDVHMCADKYCIFIKHKNILHLLYDGWWCHCNTLWELGNIILLLSNFDCPVPKILQAPNCTVHDWHLKHIQNIQIHQELCLRSPYGSYLAHTVIEYLAICTTDTIFSSCMYLFKDTFKSLTLHCLSHTCQDASNLW